MALSNYTELQAAVLDFMTRSDLTGNVADWITLAEARLNRELDPVETDQALTGVIDSRELDVSAYAIVEAMSLYRIDSSGNEDELTEKADFARRATSGVPRFWDYLPYTSKIILDCPLDAAYTFRLRYRQRFALSDGAPTNWLLANHPDVYLAASIVWGGGFVANYTQAAGFKAILDEAIPEVRSIIAQSKRGVLTLDPALTSMNRGYYDGVQ